jgi:arylsulfatase A-like enzyme
MKRWTFFWIVALLGSTAPARAADKPNVLFIFTDDQRWDTVGALGNPEIRTPNLDQLVAGGFRFNNAYCMGSMIGAVCLPSRTMVATGMSLWRIPEGRAAKCPPGTPILPVQMAQAGYVTFHCGKAGNACTFSNAAFQTNIATPKSAHTQTAAGEHVQEAVKFVEGHDGARPFFIYLAPPVPHDPRIAPEAFMKMYDPAKITLSRNFMPMHPFDNGELKVRDELLAPHPRPEAEMRRHLAEYYASISYLDQEIGRLLETVRRRGWSDRTVVIFSSDQGLAVGGRHGLMGKQNLYEHVKPPLIFAGPGVPHGQSDALVYLMDLFPTICELGGAAVPAAVEGRSLLPILRGERTKVRDALFGAYRAGQRMVRDERWKLMKFHAGGQKHTLLFDLAADPDELRNLAGDPARAGELARMEQLMAEQRKLWGDPVDFDGTGDPASKQADPGQPKNKNKK